MFLGEFCCMIVWGSRELRKAWIKKRKKKEKDDSEDEQLSPTTAALRDNELEESVAFTSICLPASFDVCGSTLMFIGLT